jgi:hypothetical protein
VDDCQRLPSIVRNLPGSEALVRVPGRSPDEAIHPSEFSFDLFRRQHFCGHAQRITKGKTGKAAVNPVFEAHSFLQYNRESRLMGLMKPDQDADANCRENNECHCVESGHGSHGLYFQWKD